MSVKLFTCKCGSTMFYNTVPHQFEEKDINNWNTFGLKAYAGVASVLICLACEKVHVPPANFSGKSRLDPNVVAYGELLNAIETRNAMLSSVGSLEEQVNQLQEEVGESGCKCPSFNHPKEEEEYVAKLDKQTNPSKDELSLNNKGSKTPKSDEPNNKGGKTVTKVKKIKKPTKKSMTEKTVDGPN